MIHTVILGAETPEAGELIRILAMHPEIELECAQTDSAGIRPLTSLHHGLIGETTLSTSSNADCRRCDMVLDFSAKGDATRLARLLEEFPEAKAIRLGRCRTEDGNNWVYGIPEINRKALVRGARLADVPSSFASMALVSLYPPALHMLLSDDINLCFEAPQSIIDSIDIAAAEREIEKALSEAQRSFTGKVTITTRPSETRRAAVMSTDIRCNVDLDTIMGLYDMYDDHHFAFAVITPTGPSEVAGTEKCVVSLSKKSPDTLHIETAADCRMRGGAGEAVHILNLLCGLHERTGLALKAIDFYPL